MEVGVDFFFAQMEVKKRASHTKASVNRGAHKRPCLSSLSPLPPTEVSEKLKGSLVF